MKARLDAKKARRFIPPAGVKSTMGLQRVEAR